MNDSSINPVDAMIDKIIGILKKEPSLSQVQQWHAINGFVPGKKVSVSVGCDDEDYEEYTKSLDQGTARFKIYASLDNRELLMQGRRRDEERLEYGERCIRQIAQNIRLCLIANYTLDGAADSSFPSKIQYLAAEGSDDLHFAVMALDVVFFAERTNRYRSFTLPITMTGPGTITPLPITPVISITDIPGYVHGVDYLLADDGSGIQWKAGGGPAEGTVLPVTWLFSADNEKVTVDRIRLDLNGEIVDIS